MTEIFVGQSKTLRTLWTWRLTLH